MFEPQTGSVVQYVCTSVSDFLIVQKGMDGNVNKEEHKKNQIQSFYCLASSSVAETIKNDPN